MNTCFYKFFIRIHSQTWAVTTFIFIFYCLIMPPLGHTYDMSCWADWASFIFQNGLTKVYESGTNYLPGHLYEIWIYSLFFKSTDEVVTNIYLLKYFSLSFDLIAVLTVCSLTKSKSFQPIIAIALFLNPAFVHNSVFWGQMDSVFSFFVFLSLLLIYYRKFFGGSLTYLIALNFKLQAILFAPLIFLLLISKVEIKYKLKDFLIGFFVLLVIQFLILAPFILSSGFHKIIGVVKSLGGESGYISLNAGNFWQLIIKGNLRWTGDWLEFSGLPLKTWGLILFTLFSFFTFFPLIRHITKKSTPDKNHVELPELFLMAALTIILFFYFNTQMHERYSYPAFLFLAAYGVVAHRWLPYLLFSFAYFLNNEPALQSINKFNLNDLAFSFQFISIIYFTLIVTLFFLLYFRKISSINF